MTAADFIPPTRSLKALREASLGCRGCHLYRCGTQTVFGEGPKRSEMMLVGEQPGDREDREGHPFVGPAGTLLDTALARAGIDRNDIYLTNVVKHFKWEPRGKRRIHKKPDLDEILACRPWLEAEIRAVRPRVLVCLGATAAQALLGRGFRVTRDRGVPLDSELADTVLATVHPSSILRAKDDRDLQLDALVQDLKVAASALG